MAWQEWHTWVKWAMHSSTLSKPVGKDIYAHAWMGLGQRDVSCAHGYGFHKMH